ncbi:MAG: iron-sulfur cluster carrier protein [Phycisphaerales bacterium]|nr:MAG: iron-sulfur cluster carrier protein [Phycisphaerales bacterium]
MSITEQQVRRWLSAVTPAGHAGDLVASGAVQWVACLDDAIAVTVHLPEAQGDPRAMEAIGGACLEAVRQGAVRSGQRVRSLRVRFVDQAGQAVRTCAYEASPKGALRPVQPEAVDSDQTQAQEQEQVQAQPQAHAPSPRSKPSHDPDGGRAADPTLVQAAHTIAVGAGKGGVGKSTVAVNIAVGLARLGRAVGLLDGDIYGPSLPTLMGLGAMEPAVLHGRFQPFLAHGVKSMTVGKLVEADKPLIWRGPMAHGAFKQLAEKTDWGELDDLVIDLPPGTGDVPLTMAQNLSLTGAVIVCTPQRVAQDDAVRAVGMFRQLGVEILGVVENMSVFIAPDGTEYDLFGRGGAQQMAQRLGVPFLGALPLTMALRANSDAGDPSANFEGDDPPGRALRCALDELLQNLQNQIALASVRQAGHTPSLTIR